MTINRMTLKSGFKVPSGSIAVVTGSNTGIGYETARGLAALGFKTIATARREQEGREAVAKIVAEDPANREVYFHPLEITEEGSRQRLVEFVREKFGGFDVLVNNAGFAYKGSVFGKAEAELTIAINYTGTRSVTEALLPLMRDGGRIINVSSRAGVLRIIGSEAVRRRLNEATTTEELDSIAADFIRAIEDGSCKRDGWPTTMYGMSKALESAYTRVLARQLPADPRNIIAVTVCPGYVATKMSSFGGSKTPEEGADCSVYCAAAPREEVKNGAFYGERKEMSYL